jgi:hypothetical protein
MMFAEDIACSPTLTVDEDEDRSECSLELGIVGLPKTACRRRRKPSESQILDTMRSPCHLHSAK